MSATTRYAAMSRRAAMTAAAMTAMVALAGCNSGGAGGAAAGDMAMGAAEGDMAMGAPEGAKVTVVEYASVTCPHCALWQTNTWPAFKAKYVDTNKVRYIFRELPTPPIDAATAGFLIARCAGEDKYFDVVHQLMATQQEMVTTSPRDWLLRTAQAAGLSEEQFNQCITDKDAIAAMDQRIQAARAQGVTGTPAFYVNDAQVITPGGEGASLADLSTAIDAELAK